MWLNSFMSWIGGKKALRELIVTLFPVYYERYIEVFGGGGWVLFHKPPGNDFEVYNDFNSLLVNLYRCVRDKPQELMESLRYVLNAREDFDAVRAALARDSPASDVQKAAWFYQLIRYSYASGLTSFGSQPHDMRSNFPLIEQAHRRLATLEHAAVIMKQQMNAMELLTTAEALNKLAAELIIHLAKVCGFCEGCETACPYDDLDGGMLELPDYIREEAGIRADAKLCAVVNEDNHTVTLAMAGYSYDLRDVPENILELLSRLDVCMGALENHLIAEDVIYGDSAYGRKERKDE